MRARFGWVLAFLGLLLAAAPTSFAQSPAAAPIVLESAPQANPDVTEQTLYTFCSQANCTDGEIPWSSLVMDTAGNLYGTTLAGGVNYGVVFMLSPNAESTGWSQSVLYTFCTQGWPCADGGGGRPLVMDETGTLYGTSAGGAFNKGSVFALTPNQSRTAWTYTLLYSFCPQGWPCPDGLLLSTESLDALVMDKSGVLYGVAQGGRSDCYEGCGVIFQLAPNLSRTAWTETVLYRFCARASCSDGGSPQGGLLMDEVGNLYGATGGGGNGYGVVFRLTPNQDRTSWTYTVLHSFCAEGWPCVDGDSPNGSLVMDQYGALYGTTLGGGNYGNPYLPALCGGGCGTGFQLTPDQTHTTWTKSVLYRFCSARDTYDNCLDGAIPHAGLTADAAGNLYGTTQSGGIPDGYGNGYGTVFRLTSAGSGWTETVLYRFCSQSGCPDGDIPLAALIMDGAGNLYGSTPDGGNKQNNCIHCGTVFRVTAGNSLTVSESGNGRVTSSPAGIDCPGACSASFAPGTQVTLTASATSGSTFSGWDGVCGGTASCQVTMNWSHSVTAAFSTNYALAVSVIGSRGGEVTSSSSGIDCGSTCSASFTAGSQVMLTATPAAGWRLLGWNGVCGGIAGNCNVTLNTNTSVAATFEMLLGIGAAPVAAVSADARLSLNDAAVAHPFHGGFYSCGCRTNPAGLPAWRAASAGGSAAFQALASKRMPLTRSASRETT
jgi:uncharacterized repeat protein (TIGR03803 family)